MIGISNIRYTGDGSQPPCSLQITHHHENRINMGIKADLDDAYREIFMAAFNTFKADPNNYKLAISTIVFSCFYLEARMNSIIKLFIFLHSDNDAIQFAEQTWKHTKRMSIMDKFDYISNCVERPVRQEDRTLFGEVNNLFDLRNRLAHYKHDEKTIASNISEDDLESYFPEEFHADIYNLLKYDKIEKSIKVVSEIENWIEYVYPEKTVGA